MKKVPNISIALCPGARAIACTEKKWCLFFDSMVAASQASALYLETIQIQTEIEVEKWCSVTIYYL